MIGKTARTLFAAAAVAVSIAGPPACAPRGEAPKQAIVILLDAARPDHFSCYGYARPTTPEIDRLAARGAVFRDAYAQGTETRTSIPRFLYSRYFAPEIFPNHHSIPYASPGDLFRKIDDQALSLPRALEARGVATAAVSAHEWISADSPFAREFAFFFDLQATASFDRRYAYPRADLVVDQAVDWIRRNRRRDYFLYLHVMDTHFPHFFEEDARAFWGEEPYGGDAFWDVGLPKDPSGEFIPEDVRYLDALYDGSLRYADRAVGRLIKALKTWGTLDDTLIVVTADHGEFLLDRKGHQTHGGAWYEPLARVPLIVHYPPKVAPGMRTEPAELVDVAPTILELFGIPVPDGVSFDGRGLFAESGDGAGRAVMAEGGIRRGRDKLVFVGTGASILGPETPQISSIRAELYDLEADPGERRDLAPDDPDTVGRLAAAYRDRLAPLYERFKGATTREQPRFAFALSAPSLRMSPAVVWVSSEENPGALIATPAPSGWLARSSWDNSWLFAKPEAGPLRLEIPIPNGRYFLVADVWGSGTIEIGGSSIPVGARVASPDLRRGPAPVDLGEFEVEGEAFSAVLRPSPGGDWFAIRYLGFDPVIEGRRAGRHDAEREARLRSLGYIK